MRVRDTQGVSWRDPAHPGTRHWASQSVSYRVPWWLLPFGWMAWLFFVLPLWLSIEVYVIFISGTITGATWLVEPSTRFHVEPRWAWRFFYLSAGAR